MIETLLEQVKAAVDRFVAKNPSFRNDRDDLVQDVFLKILPQMNGGEFSLQQCRAFAHQATFWTCQTALRVFLNQKQKKTVSLGYAGVQYLGWWSGGSDVENTLAEMTLGGFIADRPFIDWCYVEEIVKENDALLTWFAIEPDPEINENLWEQIIDKFEVIVQ